MKKNSNGDGKESGMCMGRRSRLQIT